MKKITLLLAVVFIAGNLFSQTLTNIASWPNATWTVTGTFNASNFLMNPTVTSDKFQYDDSIVSSTSDDIAIESPTIDLSTAFTAGEKALKLIFSASFAITIATSETIRVEYWNHDTSSWVLFPNGSVDPGDTAGDYTNCTGSQAVGLYLDISSFTTNQQQNFRYRFKYDDGGLALGKGICLASPSLTSLSCNNAPTALAISNINVNAVNVGWTTNNSEIEWLIEYGGSGFSLGTGTPQNTNLNPSGLGGLTSGTNYDVYVRGDCSNGDGVILSPWSSKKSFTTTSAVGWLNLQWPGSGSINAGDTFDVFAQIWVDGVTTPAGQGIDIQSWIGYNTADTDPSTWPIGNWFVASYNGDSGNNDEYMLNLGAKLTTAGTYYYASRFQYNSEFLQYGGFNGGPWNGSSNVSGVLTVTGTLGIGDNKIEGFNFYPNPIKDRLVLSARQSINQVEVYNLLGQVLMVTQPNLNNYEMQLSSLRSGIYFLKITVADKTGTYKIVKQ